MITVGIDEVGRGCWAGPVVAGAVVLNQPIAGLKDSKLLSKLQREKLAATIRVEASAIGLGWVSAGEVDALGLTAAVRLAMQRALAEITIDFDEIIIDGSFNFLGDDPRARTLVKADSLIPAVSAASIVAKVARDEFMTKAAVKFPNYYFERHVGYGTTTHLDMLKLHGVCALHRLTYKPVKQFIVSSRSFIGARLKIPLQTIH